MKQRKKVFLVDFLAGLGGFLKGKKIEDIRLPEGGNIVNQMLVNLKIVNNIKTFSSS